MRMRGLDLEFRANPRRSTTDGRTVRPYAGPVAVLVDELSASASECFAGGLQALGRARVFGVTSSGQALPAATQQLANGDVLLYAVGDFVTPNGRRLEGAGVVPDEVVPVTAEALAAGRDAEAAALAWIERVTAP
jgi:carboxyl-terminal processing protease